MDIRMSRLKVKIMLESNPLKSRIVVQILAVLTRFDRVLSASR